MSDWDGKERRKLNNDDHDLLIRIETKLDRALGDLDSIDIRVKTLESGYWKIIGSVGAVVLLGDFIIKMLVK